MAARFGRKLLTRFLLWGSAIAVERNYEREHTSLPEGRVVKIRIYGEDQFLQDMLKALMELEQKYPYGYALVQRYIRAIVQTKARSRSEGWPAVVYRKTNAEGRIGIAPNRFAAALVRHAIAIRKFSGFCIWRSNESKLHSLRHELRAMQLLDCDHKYFHRVWNEILKRESILNKQGKGKGGHIRVALI